MAAKNMWCRLVAKISVVPSRVRKLDRAAPVIVFSLVLQVATGLVGRVMPQFQIFFASTPLAVLLGLSVFVLSLGGAMMIWLQHYSDFLQPFT